MAYYLAGPMSGIEDHNYPAFHDAAFRWRQKGYHIINPAEAHNGDQTLPYGNYIARAMHDVCQAQGVIVLKGWEDSQGAQLEVHLAEVLGLPVLEDEGN